MVRPVAYPHHLVTLCRISDRAFSWLGLNTQTMQLLTHDFKQVGQRKSLHLNLVFAEVPKPSI